MVISEVSEGERTQNFMEMTPKRSKRLHNFSMPCLKWGNQRLLRCMNVNSNGEISCFDRRLPASEAESEGLIKESDSLKRRSSSSFESFRKSSPLPPIRTSERKTKIDRDADETIEAIREKLMFHLRTAADCKAPDDTGRGGSVNKEQQQKYSPKRTENLITKSLRLRGLAAAQGVEKKERRKFSISLSRDEIKEDFAAMAGKKLSGKPKKRAKIVQKQLDALFPGLWLVEVTEDSYKVPDDPKSRKN